MIVKRKPMKKVLPKRKIIFGHSELDPKVKQSIKTMVEEEVKKNGYKRSEDPFLKEVDKLFKRYTGKGLDI